MTAPVFLDLFSGEGLAAYGYAQALPGWRIVCVENDPERIANHVRHPRIEVIEGDATTYPLDGATAVHASPPCTEHTTLAGAAQRARGARVDTGWMLPHTLDRLAAWGGPWIVENVTGARRKMPGAVKLCGTMFGLQDEGWHLARHRWFSTSWPLQADRACTCRGKKIIGIYGDLMTRDRRCAGKRLNRPNGDMRASVERARRLLGAPWASPRGLALGLPWAYTRWLGSQLRIELECRTPAIGGLTGLPGG